MNYSDLPHNTQHPTVLAKHKIVNLIIQRVHRQCLHGGVKLTLSTLKQNLSILNSRPQIKSVLFKCLGCAKLRATLSTILMALLPKYRTTHSYRPFMDCGIDYAGPYQVRIAGRRGRRSQQCWIAVFVCFAVKAIHLEVVSIYSTEY